MRTTLAALAGAGAALAAYSPDSYSSDNSPPAYGGESSSSVAGTTSSSSSSSYIAGTSSSAASAASGTPDFPSCWSSCFQQAGVTSAKDTCDDSDLTSCIEDSCSSEDADTYKGWLAKECGTVSTSSNVVGPTGSSSMSYGPSGYPASSSLSGYPHPSGSGSPAGPSSYPVGPSSYPVGPSGYVASSSGFPGGYGNCTTTYSSVCTETETLIYRSTTAYVPTTITHIFTTALPSGSCSGAPFPISSSLSVPASSSVPYSPVTTSGVPAYPGSESGSPSGPASGYPSGPASGYPSGSAGVYPSGPASGYPSGAASGYPSGPAGVYPSAPAGSTVVTDVTTSYTTVCPVTETAGSVTSVYQTTSEVTETYQTTIVVTPSAPASPETFSSPASPVTTSAAGAVPSNGPSCWNTCFSQNGVTSKEGACIPAVGACIDSTCSDAEAAQFDSWAEDFCVEDSSLPTEPASGSGIASSAPAGGVPSAPAAGIPSAPAAGVPSAPAAGVSSAPAAGAASAPAAGAPSAPAAGNGGAPQMYTSISPVTKPFTYGEWTSYYTDFETVTMTYYATETATEGSPAPTGGYGGSPAPSGVPAGSSEGSPVGPASSVPAGGYGGSPAPSGVPAGPSEGSPVGPAPSAPAGGYSGHETTATQVYATTVVTAYTTICPATESSGLTTSTLTTTSTISLTFTVTTTDYPSTSSSVGGGVQPPYPLPTGSSISVGPTGVYPTGTGSVSSSYPAGPTGTGSSQPQVPDCWAKCFAASKVTAEKALCGDINAETCIKAECSMDSYNAYEAWLDAYCGVASTSSGVAGPTGSGFPAQSGSGFPAPSGSGAPLPTGTSAPTGTIGTSSSSTCALPTATKACKRCDGQPGTDKYCGLDINTNIYKDGGAPITCDTVEYTWEVSTGNVSPDGVERQAILVNGQSPGPMLKANWGDEIIVHVKNSMPVGDLNGTTIHWHGIRQKGTPEFDGTPSLSQCPIAPGETFTYKFRATQYGSSWYHSHFALQAYDGLFGPIVIDGPVQEGAEYDGEEFVSLQDWRHAPLTEIYNSLELVSNNQRSSPTLDTGLINGKNTWDGAGERWSMTVTKGKTYRLRVLNAAVQSTFKFYIDGHSFKVIAADFVPIEPYETNIININNGQRYDVIFTADQPSDNYWMRSDVQAPCSNVTNGLDIKAIVHYDDAPQAEPTSTAYSYTPECIDEPMANLVPVVPWNAGASSDEIDKDVLIVPNGGNPNLFKWTLSGTSFFSQWSDPTLQSIYDDGTVPTYSGDLAIREDNLGEWIYVIIDSVIPLPHPIHLHGHDFLVLAQGIGPYNAGVQLNLNNPPRRDTAIMPFQLGQGAVGGYLVVAFYTDNPGVWLMHCHIGWHVAMGFALQIIEGLDEIKDTVEYPCQMKDNCDAWHAFANEYGITTQASGV